MAGCGGFVRGPNRLVSSIEFKDEEFYRTRNVVKCGCGFLWFWFPK